MYDPKAYTPATIKDRCAADQLVLTAGMEVIKGNMSAAHRNALPVIHHGVTQEIIKTNDGKTKDDIWRKLIIILAKKRNGT